MKFLIKQKNGFIPQHKNLCAGFTMIELLVGMSVFVIIIAITSGIFITSMRSNRTSVALISANSDAQLTLEQMARIVRKGLGTSFLSETVIGNGTVELPQFRCLHFRYGNDYIVYRWNRSDKSLEWNVGSDNYASCGDTTVGVFSGIISENLKVELASFRVDDSLSVYY